MTAREGWVWRRDVPLTIREKSEEGAVPLLENLIFELRKASFGASWCYFLQLIMQTGLGH